MTKRLSGNMSAPITFTRGEYNRRIKEARKEGMIEGIAQEKKRALRDCVKEIVKNHYESLGCIDIMRIGGVYGLKVSDLFSRRKPKNRREQRKEAKE